MLKNARTSRARAPYVALPPWSAAALLAVLVVALGADLLRMGLFADDFHFLDVARRMPVGDVLLGKYGVWPWYRPLSRELYFYVVAGAGPAGFVVARLLNMACLTASAWALDGLGRKLFGTRAGLGAAVLLITYGYTKFFLAWGSGFQDLLVMALILWALLDHLEGRSTRSLVLAGLAPLAKETGFVAAPLILAFGVVGQGKRRPEPWMLWQALVWVGAVAVHVAVRSSWAHRADTTSAPVISRGPISVLLEMLTSTFTIGPLPGAWGVVAGTLAAASVFALCGLAARGTVARASAGVGRANLLVVIAAVLGAAPLALLRAQGTTVLNVRFVYAAIPWLALLAAQALARLPARAWQWSLVAIAGVNILGLSYRAPDLSAESGWTTGVLDWSEAMRIEAKSRRMADDIRGPLATRPESTVVLYNGLPYGGWFQTGDGPATREALRDPTVRAYYINQAPRGIPGDRMAVFTFDWIKTHHLLPVKREPAPALREAMVALFEKRARAAYTWASFCPAEEEPAKFYARYVAAASVLVEEGPAAYGRALDSLGWGDSSGVAAASATRGLRATADSLVARGYEGVFRNPLSVSSHQACAEFLLGQHAGLPACVEFRIALSLRGDSGADHARFGLLLESLAVNAAARQELVEAVALGGGDDVIVRAREALLRMPSE